MPSGSRSRLWSVVPTLTRPRGIVRVSGRLRRPEPRSEDAGSGGWVAGNDSPAGGTPAAGGAWPAAGTAAARAARMKARGDMPRIVDSAPMADLVPHDTGLE